MQSAILRFAPQEGLTAAGVPCTAEESSLWFLLMCNLLVCWMAQIKLLCQAKICHPAQLNSVLQSALGRERLSEIWKDLSCLSCSACLGPSSSSSSSLSQLRGLELLICPSQHLQPDSMHRCQKLSLPFKTYWTAILSQNLVCRV